MISPPQSTNQIIAQTVAVTLLVNIIVLAATIWSGAHV